LSLGDVPFIHRAAYPDLPRRAAGRAELVRRAETEGLTKSALIRRAIEAYLSGPDDEELRLARFKAAVGAVAGIAPDLEEGRAYVERLRALDADRQARIEQRRGR